jgi:hypothetical protein
MTLEAGVKALAEAVAVDVKALVEVKVDKVSGKGLSDTNFTQVEKTKLSGVAVGATKNRADTLNADKIHSHAISDVTGLSTRLSDIGDLSQLLIDGDNLVDAVNGTLNAVSDAFSEVFDRIDTLSGDVESVLIAINGEP